MQSSSQTLTPEKKIRLLLTLINDEGWEKFESGYSKLLTRLHEFYESNQQDIITYFIKVIVAIPLKSGIYAKALRAFAKVFIIKEVFKGVIQYMKKTIDYCVHMRCLNFFINCVVQGLICKNDFEKFIEECICGNGNLIGIILRSIIYIYDNTKEEFLFVKDICIYINEQIQNGKCILSEENSKIFEQINNSILKPTETQENNINDKLFLLQLTKDENEIDISEIQNPFNEILHIDYSFILYPNEHSPSIIEKDLSKTYETYHYEYILIDILSSMKNSYQLCSRYLLNLHKFFGIAEKESSLQQTVLSLLPSQILCLSLNPISFNQDVTLYASLVVNFIKSTPSYEESFTNVITSFISKQNNLKGLSAFQIQNLVSFLTFYSTNIPNSKSGILNIKIDINSSNYNYYYGKCLCDKMSNLITIENFTQTTKLYDDTFIPLLLQNSKPKEEETLLSNDDYIIMSENIQIKNNFDDFKSKLHNQDIKSNELLYNFIACILIKKGKTLSHLREAFYFYTDVISEMLETNSEEKEKILLKAIFDIWSNSSNHLIFLIELLYNNYLLSHSNVVKFIFSEKLNQTKENVLNWVYYELIGLTLSNAEHLIGKVKEDLKEEQLKLANSNEEQRPGIIKKIEKLEISEERLGDGIEGVFNGIKEKFEALEEAAERLGGEELKGFLQKTIKHFEIRYYVKMKMGSEEDVVMG